MLKESRDCHPAGCASPMDRPPLPGAPPATTARLFPCSEPPALADALCFPSLAAWCSAISARGDGFFFFFFFSQARASLLLLLLLLPRSRSVLP